MVTAKARIKSRDDYASIVPIVIPDLYEVRKFAAKLHAEGKAWKGEVFGWQAEYNPERPEPPLDSKMTFTPADFCIGESGIWFFSLMWEHGSDAEPVEFWDDRNIFEKTQMTTVTFVVNTMPPWKQIPADKAEKARQTERKQSLQEKAKEAFNVSIPLSIPCAVSIRYSRSKGKSDSANIIGGVLDSLQSIIFNNDNQVVEISYAEWSGNQDWYQVTVTEIARRTAG